MAAWSEDGKGVSLMNGLERLIFEIYRYFRVREEFYEILVEEEDLEDSLT